MKIANRILCAVLVLGMILLPSCANSSSNGGSDAPSGAGRAPATPASGGAETDAIPSGSNSSGQTRLTFACTGDNIVHESLFVQAAEIAEAMAGSEAEKPSYRFDSMYDDAIREMISSADIAFCNQEGPISGLEPHGYPNFNAPKEAGDALVAMGFDIINIANNHMLDMEHLTTGYENSINYWKQKDVLMVGGYENQADYAPRYIERKGVRIAVLSYTYGTNGYSVNPRSSAVVPLIDDAVITSQVTEARANADLVLVSMHWGAENEQSVTSEQQRLAKLLANLGADAVIGHHSHTVQPIEWIEGSGGNKTLVIYSLGNFISSQLYAKNLVGEIVTFDIVKDAGQSRARIENVVSNPTVTHYLTDVASRDSLDLERRYDVHVYLMKDYTEDQCATHGAHVWDSFNFNFVRGYITNTIAPEFLPDYLKDQDARSPGEFEIAG